MDSMTSLNSSLPKSGGNSRSGDSASSRQASGDLLSAFKAAALSVTQLYKTAAADEDAAREAGYQVAIDDLLTFLDRENLGLKDGEGWRVRQWATERLNPCAFGSDVDDTSEDDSRKEESSPAQESKLNQDLRQKSSSSSSSTTEQPPKSADAAVTIQPTAPATITTPREMFHFQAGPTHSAAADLDMANADGLNFARGQSPRNGAADGTAYQRGNDTSTSRSARWAMARERSGGVLSQTSSTLAATATTGTLRTAEGNGAAKVDTTRLLATTRLCGVWIANLQMTA